MAFTRHWHQIPSTPVEELPSGKSRARCGGPKMCFLCAEDVLRMYQNVDNPTLPAEEELYFDDRTMEKVRMALWRSGMSYDEATDVIHNLQNAGILFRERKI